MEGHVGAGMEADYGLQTGGGRVTLGNGRCIGVALNIAQIVPLVQSDGRQTPLESVLLLPPCLETRKEGSLHRLDCVRGARRL